MDFGRMLLEFSVFNHACSIGGVDPPISSQPLSLRRSGLLVHHLQLHRVLQEINVT
jgi:hypothetical protein